MSNTIAIQELDQPWYASLVREIHDRIFPTKLPPLELTSKAVEVQELEVSLWYTSLVREIRDLVRPPQLPPLELTSKAVEVQSLEFPPWYASLVREIRDRIRPPKLPPLELTSQPVEVREFGGGSRLGKGSISVSLAIHGVTVALAIGMQLGGMIDVPTLDIASRAVLLMPPPAPPGPPTVLPTAARIIIRQPVQQGLQFPVDVEMPEVAVVEAPSPPPDLSIGVPGGVAGGVPGGVAGGMGGGIVGGVISQMLNQIAVPTPPPPPEVATNLSAAPAPPPEPQPPQRIEVSAEVQQGKLLVAIPPAYPSVAKQSRIQGKVRLEAVIAKDGTLSEINVLEGHPLLIPAAIEAVTKWRYRPTFLNGNPVEVHTLIDVNFRLT
jgi:protein TonB